MKRQVTATTIPGSTQGTITRMRASQRPGKRWCRISAKYMPSITCPSVTPNVQMKVLRTAVGKIGSFSTAR